MEVFLANHFIVKPMSTTADRESCLSVTQMQQKIDWKVKLVGAPDAEN